MTNDEQHALLIDLAEGTLTGERAAAAAALLERSETARADLALIRSALEELGAAPSGTVPAHYFADFLPRLRSRIEENGRRGRWVLPAFTDLLVRPVMAAAAVLVFFVSYSAFEPQPSSSPLYDLFRTAAMEEIAGLKLDHTLLASTGEMAVVDLTLSEEAFGLNADHYQSVSELDAALEENEMQQIVDQLETDGTRKEQL
ncbi:MAG: hypothetical protein HUU02_09600 [Bacteroidetes bacterium]|nr:hypothetical protein [Bacteroidota bacterium]